MERLFDICPAEFRGRIPLHIWRVRPDEQFDHPGNRPGVYPRLAKARTRLPCGLT